MEIEGQYGDWSDLKVGQRVEVRATGIVTEVGMNYAEIEVDQSGDEITVNNDWEVDILEEAAS